MPGFRQSLATEVSKRLLSTSLGFAGNLPPPHSGAETVIGTNLSTTVAVTLEDPKPRTGNSQPHQHLHKRTIWGQGLADGAPIRERRTPRPLVTSIQFTCPKTPHCVVRPSSSAILPKALERPRFSRRPASLPGLPLPPPGKTEAVGRAPAAPGSAGGVSVPWTLEEGRS